MSSSKKSKEKEKKDFVQWQSTLTDEQKKNLNLAYVSEVCVSASFQSIKGTIPISQDKIKEQVLGKDFMTNEFTERVLGTTIDISKQKKCHRCHQVMRQFTAQMRRSDEAESILYRCSNPNCAQ
jgi:DNA-directed RNA polymerase subunit M/transcription elongation factor TFIIS